MLSPKIKTVYDAILTVFLPNPLMTDKKDGKGFRNLRSLSPWGIIIESVFLNGPKEQQPFNNGGPEQEKENLLFYVAKRILSFLVIEMKLFIAILVNKQNLQFKEKHFITLKKFSFLKIGK